MIKKKIFKIDKIKKNNFFKIWIEDFKDEIIANSNNVLLSEIKAKLQYFGVSIIHLKTFQSNQV